MSYRARGHIWIYTVRSFFRRSRRVVVRSRALLLFWNTKKPYFIKKNGLNFYAPSPCKQRPTHTHATQTWTIYWRCLLYRIRINIHFRCVGNVLKGHIMCFYYISLYWHGSNGFTWIFKFCARFFFVFVLRIFETDFMDILRYNLPTTLILDGNVCSAYILLKRHGSGWQNCSQHFEYI